MVADQAAVVLAVVAVAVSQHATISHNVVTTTIAMVMPITIRIERLHNTFVFLKIIILPFYFLSKLFSSKNYFKIFFQTGLSPNQEGREVLDRRK